jgi:ATP-dependent Clp protease adaptor protein ClpS
VSEERDGQGAVIRRAKPEEKVARPPLFRVLLHNDDYTTRDFVVEVLRAVFRHDETEAVRIMLHVHYRGVGVAGVYTREVAETKVHTVEELAREYEFPLRLSIEPEEDEWPDR